MRALLFVVLLFCTGLVVGSLGWCIAVLSKPVAKLQPVHVIYGSTGERPPVTLESIARDTLNPKITGNVLKAIIRVESAGNRLAKRKEPELLKRLCTVAKRRNGMTFFSIAPGCLKAREPEATSHGFMQVLGSTAKKIGVHYTELYRPIENIETGAFVYRKCMEHEKNDRFWAAACYNAGPKKNRKFYPASSVEYARKVMKDLNNA